ncbi:hypothetical protein Rs2_18418 [Raphanus sativus]|nr:hypothetical protein Rs2_18418 [Raphanus sativus]
METNTNEENETEEKVDDEEANKVQSDAEEERVEEEEEERSEEEKDQRPEKERSEEKEEQRSEEEEKSERKERKRGRESNDGGREGGREEGNREEGSRKEGIYNGDDPQIGNETEATNEAGGNTVKLDELVQVINSFKEDIGGRLTKIEEKVGEIDSRLAASEGFVQELLDGRNVNADMEEEQQGVSKRSKRSRNKTKDITSRAKKKSKKN